MISEYYHKMVKIAIANTKFIYKTFCNILANFYAIKIKQSSTMFATSVLTFPRYKCRNRILRYLQEHV